MAIKGRNKSRTTTKKSGPKTPKMPKDPRVGHGKRFGSKPAGFRTRVSRGVGGSKLGVGAGRSGFGSPVGPRVEKMLDFNKRKRATQQATPNRKRIGVKTTTRPKKFPSFRSGSQR